MCLSTDNPVIMLIFLIYSLVLCWGKVSNSNVTMKFAHLHYFSSQNVWEDKIYYVPPVQKLGVTCPRHPPLNSVPVWVSAIPAAYLLIDCCATRHSLSLLFFAVVNCADVALSVFHSAVLNKPVGRIEVLGDKMRS